MSERFRQLLNGAPGPTWEDLGELGALDAAKPPSGPPGPGGPEEPSVVDETLVGAAALVFEWGFMQLSEWMKVWAQQQTVLHTWGRISVPVGERLHLWMGHADDRADLWFNDESLNHKNLGEEGTWSITGGRVKKGANVLVVGVDNSGRGRYGVQVIAQRGSDNARIDKACLNIQGDEGPFTGRRHIYFIQIIGASPRGGVRHEP